MADSDYPTTQNERYRRLYGVDMTRLAPNSTEAQIVTLIDNMILSRLTPQSAAEEAASIVMSETMPENPWAEVSRIPFHAALYLDEPGSEKLVEFMTALVNLPDAINTSPSRKTATTYNPEVKDGILVFEPGDPIVFENGVLWRDLPDWNMNVTETHQGPELWLRRDSEEEAARKWKNWSMYMALFVTSPNARATPFLSDMCSLSLRTLAITLETPTDRWNFHKRLWMPAAEQIMRIAGDELEKICEDVGRKYSAGDLWEAEGGGDEYDSRRFGFWRKRLAEQQT